MERLAALLAMSSPAIASFLQRHIFLQPTIRQFLPTAAHNSRIRPLRSQLLFVCDRSMTYSFPCPMISGQLPGYLLTRRVKAAR